MLYANQGIPESTVIIEREDHSLPPPYPGQPAEFNLPHKQLFNKY